MKKCHDLRQLAGINRIAVSKTEIKNYVEKNA